MSGGLFTEREIEDIVKRADIRSACSDSFDDAMTALLIGAPLPANDGDFERPVLDRKSVETAIAKCALCGCAMVVFDWHLDTARIQVSRWDLGRYFEGPAALEELGRWLERMPERRA